MLGGCRTEKERRGGKDALMRLHRLLLATDGCRSPPPPLPRLPASKALLVRPPPPIDLKERHLFATAARLHPQGYPRARRSALLRSAASHVRHQLPSPVINNEIIASANNRRSCNSQV